MNDAEPQHPTRRGVLQGVLGGAIGFGLGAGASTVLSGLPEAAAPVPSSAGVPSSTSAAPSTGAAQPERVPASGSYQAGIHLPAVPQRFGRVVVLDTELASADWLSALGVRILELTERIEPSDLLPDGPGDLTISVGIGPRLVVAIDPSLPGATALPPFAGDDAIDQAHLGGDLVLSAHSSDPTVLGAVLADLTSRVPDARLRWEQLVFRGTGEGTKARNPLGFMDGVVVPRGEAELRQSVWIGEGRMAGATVCVIRRLRIDTARFREQPVEAREAIIGRRLGDGAPLSGGGPDDQVDLNAKTPEGDFLVPARSHSRGAHPSFTGSGLMFRRSYSFENGAEAGLLFVSFQNELRTFVATQQRLDEVDELMTYTTPTASGTFLMLPGFSAQQPLGSGLFA